MGKFIGKYRAKVTDINDPAKRGRIRVECPKVFGSYSSGWCDPCFPCDGDFCLPSVGSTVWVEFQQDDLSKPIWSGAWYADGKAPAEIGTRIISYAGATIVLSGGKVSINGVEINGELNSLADKIKALESRIARVESRL